MASEGQISPMRAEPMGLHINPSRSRAGSATPDHFRIRQTPAPSTRTPSVTSFMSSKLMSPAPSTQDEKSPLINKSTTDEENLSVLRDGSLSLNSLSVALLYTVKRKGLAYWLRMGKITILFGITVLCSVTVVTHPETKDVLHEAVARTSSQDNGQITKMSGDVMKCRVERRNEQIREKLYMSQIVMIYSDAFDDSYPILQLNVMGPLSEDSIINASDIGHVLFVNHALTSSNDTAWTLKVNRSALVRGELTEFHHKFRCHSQAKRCNLTVHLTEDLAGETVPLVYTVDKLSTQVDNEILYAALILIFVYILIIFELVHRTLAAMLGALAALAVLSAINQRPSIEMIVAWMEMETLMLLFGMMIIVAVVSETGIFDYSALKAYKLAKGKVWRLVTLLCLFSAFVSAFLDNVTTILLLAPVTIRLCEVLNLEPRVILIAEVLFSNIGGTATAIGDPPNVIIVSALESRGIIFSVFTLHLAVGIFFIAVLAYGFLRLYYRNMSQLSNPDPVDIAELRHEIEMWKRAASRLVVVTREETLMKALFLQRTVELENLLNKKLHRKRQTDIQDLNERLRQLEVEYQIKDMVLLVKCGFVLTTIILFFFLYSLVSGIYLGLGWIAMIGAMWLLVISDMCDLDSILHRVEWSTLLFFSALFILMEALTELRLMEWIGEQVQEMIKQVDTEYRLTAAVVIIVWISALASSFIDNIPYTTAMIPVLKQLSDDTEVNLQLLPLVMALAFGACLGGNGTLIGASANVVCAGIAEQHGYSINFKQFFKVGFPMMLVTTVGATVYLLISHSALSWNDV